MRRWCATLIPFGLVMILGLPVAAFVARPSPASPAGVYSDHVLDQARMETQLLSSPGSPSSRDYQLPVGRDLRTASTPEFADALAKYQQQIDHMLARTP